MKKTSPQNSVSAIAAVLKYKKKTFFSHIILTSNWRFLSAEKKLCLKNYTENVAKYPAMPIVLPKL